MNLPLLVARFREIEPVLRANNNPSREGFALIEHKTDSDSWVKFTQEQVKLFNSMVSDILKQDGLSEKFSAYFVEKQVLDCCHRILSGTNVEDSVSELVRVFSRSITEFIIFSLIDNVEFQTQDVFEVIDSTIKVFVEDDIPSTAQAEMFRHSGLIGRPAIFTKVSAGEIEKAKEMALRNFTLSLTLLRLYRFGTRPFLRGDFISSRRQELINYNITQDSFGASTSTPNLFVERLLILDDSLRSQVMANEVKELKANTQFSQVMKSCLYWYGQSLDENEYPAKLVKAVAVLECALKRGSEITELARAVRERGAILIAPNFKTRKEVCKALGNIYDERSGVLHAGESDTNRNLSFRAMGFARLVIIKMLEHSARYSGDFDKFITELDDAKLKSDFPDSTYSSSH